MYYYTFIQSCTLTLYINYNDQIIFIYKINIIVTL